MPDLHLAVAPLDLVDLWLDHERVGCGRRIFIVAKLGRTQVRLVSPASLVGVTVDRDAFARGAPAPVPHRRRDLARRIRQRVRRHRALGLPDGGGALRRVIAGLEARHG